MNLVVIGTGYVGLVTGACFAEMGNFVTCVDVDAEKIEGLKQGVLPIHEPGLEQIVVENYQSGRLHFTTSLISAMENSDVFFIAVGTPQGEDGSADLQYVLSVAREIGQNLQRPAIIVGKSTVPVGTGDKVREVVQSELDVRNISVEFDVVSNPEFLKEGAAVDDFMRPDRIIVGADSQNAKDIMSELYGPFNRSHQRMVFMGVRDAEMTKYTANAMLATKISFMNEIANFCERLEVDVENVRKGIGADQRIGFHFIYPGCGYGGSCFPKDVQALIHIAKQIDFDAKILKSVEDRNALQKKLLLEKIINRFGSDLSDKTFAVWGLAFKPGTDDMREATSKVIISGLITAGAKVKAYDPVAMGVARREFPDEYFLKGDLVLVDNQYSALSGADGLILVTEWKPFRYPDFKKIKGLLGTPIIFDGRNQYDPKALRNSGFEYFGVGR